ncbi:hypothetical protein [Dictyobacter aurantiacus]|uniref:Uncharacterized protein n=1 Tax=Dictyobacter aurantiacus TaxID=1936993 RepID=A0A401ZMX7_9CHLR|nr:hypothetical protein [Dictyobacter aurantiacus]GCE08116.1 hypothetical protein KDAU_54450 [Dictyobacter aurantiacus]
MLNQILNFIEGQYVYCPRCLHRLPIRSQVKQDVPCEECHFTIPLAYIRGCKDAPPVFVQLFGLTEAGKTMFLDMLRLHLYDMDRAWGAAGFYAQPITQLDVEHKNVLQAERVEGVLPGSTPKRDRDQNEVYIMSLKHMVRWGSRFLVVMDHAGEQFGRLVIDVAEIPFLQHTPVTIMLLSLPDLLRDKMRVDNLVNSYITSLEERRVNFARERRQLIIVFSKADIIPDLAPELRDYLSQDTVYESLKGNFTLSEAELDAYMQQMEVISHATRLWVEKSVQGGAAMLHMLDDRGIDTRFTVMSATGHPLSTDGNRLAPSPRRVLDPFFWLLEYYKRLGPQNIVQARWSTILATFLPGLRLASSLVLLILLFCCALGGGIYAFQFSQGSSAFTGLSLSLVLLCICSLVQQRLTDKHDPVLRGLLRVAIPAFFLACVALQTIPTVQQALSQIMLYQLLGISIIGTALFSCFQPAARVTAQSRVTLATIVGSAALLQYVYGAQQQLPSLPYLQTGISASTYSAINTTLVVILFCVAVLVLLLSTPERIWFDRVALGMVALVYGAFQLVYGTQEINDAFSSAGPLFQSRDNIAIINNIIIFVVAIVLPISLFILHRFARIDRLPLLILALVCAGMLNFLGDGVALPYGPYSTFTLTWTIADLLSSTQIVIYGLIIAGVLMLIRWLFTRFSGTFTFWDHVMLFFTALVCAQLQVFPWESSVLLTQTPELQATFSTLNNSIAGSLTWLMLAGSIGVLALLLLPLARQITQIERVATLISERASWLVHVPVWFEHMLIASTASGCALLIGLYGLTDPTPAILYAIGGIGITWYQIAALLFVILAIISIGRLTRPLTRSDRFLLLMNIVLCTVFYVAKGVPQIPLSSVLQNWDEGAYNSQLPNLLFGMLLAGMALIFLWWSTNQKRSGDRRLLQIIFVLALTSSVLQLWVSSLFFTLLALLALIMGVVIAALSTSSML